MSLRKYVGAGLLDAAAKQAEALMAANPALKEAWLDQIRVSKASQKVGGPLLFVTDWDWVPAFWVWHAGSGHVLPIERMNPALKRMVADHG